MDIAQMLDSQTIQTALEKQSSALSDVAFQSYITNAPIPRAWYGAVTNTFALGATTFAQWNKTANYFDPYNMIRATTTDLSVPIDGFYEVTVNYVGASPAVAAFSTFQLLRNAVVVASAVPANAAGGVQNCSLHWCGACSANDVFNTSLTNNSGALYTATAANFGVVWVAPYRQFTTQGGN